MLKHITIAVDIMGGDFGPSSVVEAVMMSLDRYHNVSFVLFGDVSLVSQDLIDQANAAESVSWHDTKKYISSDERPSSALRNRSGSSMYLAILCAKEGNADVVISSGNTGALMAISRLALGTMKNIDRPAICKILPSTRGYPVLFLDLGANVDCTPQQILQFAIMGNAFYSAYSNKESITFSLLNIGKESIKGNSVTRSAFDLLKKYNLGATFLGYIEPNEIMLGYSDVVITDGFTGNAVLKTMEGLANIVKDKLRSVFKFNFITKIAYFLIKKKLIKEMKMLDPQGYNGAMLLGLEGVVIKSHGNADTLSFLSAINAAASLARSNVNEQIRDVIARTVTIQSTTESDSGS